MNESVLFGTVIGLTILVFFIGIGWHEYATIKSHKERIQWVVNKQGGKDVVVKKIFSEHNNRFRSYWVRYTTPQGNREKSKCKVIDHEIYWSNALIIEPTVATSTAMVAENIHFLSSTPHSVTSKEQIIDDLEAEVARLQMENKRLKMVGSGVVG